MWLNALRREWQSWTLAAVVLSWTVGLIYWSRVDFSEKTVPGGDTAVYVLLARSLKEHGDLRSVWSVGEPLHGQLSPGFPALLVPFLTDSGMEVGPVRGLIVVLTALSVLFIYFVFRHAGKLLAMAVAVLTGLNGLVFLYGRSILSEVPYMFLTVAGMLLWGYYEYLKRRDLAFEALLALALAAAFLMRTVGIFLVLAVVLRMLIAPGMGGVRGLLKRPFLCWGILAVVGWWLARQVAVSLVSEQSYWHEFLAGDEARGMGWAPLAERWCRGIYALVFYSIPQVLTNVRFTGRSAGAAALSLVFAFGLLRGVLFKRRVMDIYVTLYLTAAASWPWVQTSGARYMTPLVPFIIYYFLKGMIELLRWSESRTVPKVLLFLSLFGLVIIYGRQCPLAQAGTPAVKVEAPEWGLYRWVRSQVPQDAVVASYDPAAVFFYTGRHAPDIAITTQGVAQITRLLESGRAGWFIDDERLRESRVIVDVLLRDRPELLRMEFQSGPYRVFRARPAGRVTGSAENLR